MKKKIFIANWKIFLSYSESIAWCNHFKDELRQLSCMAELVICPTLPAIPLVAAALNTTGVSVGAQRCDSYAGGAYTGAISAPSLREAGATYCIVGHSESRLYLHDSDDTINKQIAQLFSAGITPILCIASIKQLEVVMQGGLLSLHQKIIIAYEPLVSIGTGIILPLQELEQQLGKIRSYIENISAQAFLVYGGSVTVETINFLKNIACIDGFLIGKASIDFQLFKKIVLSAQRSVDL